MWIYDRIEVVGMALAFEDFLGLRSFMVKLYTSSMLNSYTRVTCIHGCGSCFLSKYQIRRRVMILLLVLIGCYSSI
jgi:hypothetical protein